MENDVEKLNEYRKQIKQQVPFVDKRPFSHNIINVTLQVISNRFGHEEANRAIDDFGLSELGWEKVDVAASSKLSAKRKSIIR